MARTPALKPASEFPSVSVIERRIATGDANVGRVLDIRLVGQPEPMDVRLINTGHPGRFYQVTQELGWVPVEANEVEGGLSGDLRAVDGRVVLGEKGTDVLMKMPVRYRRQIQRSKEDRQHRAMTSKAALRQRVQTSFERDAKDADRDTARAYERQAEALGGIEVETLQVGRERIPLGE